MHPETIVETPLTQKARAYVRDVFENHVAEDYTYHNLAHTLRVTRKLIELVMEAGVDGEDRENLILSALFHDTGFSRSDVDHEEHSKAIAREFLTAEGFSQERIEVIEGCIDATRLGNVPTNKQQMLLKDADTSSLGSEDFDEHTENLRKELNTVHNEGIDELGWDHINLQFLKEHRFYTPEARRRYEKTKKDNIKEIERKLGMRKEKAAKPPKPKMVTIGTSKSAQTQFKTALRNHIDLSAIADNKANTMLSVTSLIISLSLPFLGATLSTNPRLLIPTIILLFVCVTAIIFATLATRPISMKGQSTMEDIYQKRSNLFFFGNFYRMSFSDYEEGIKQVVANDEFLDNAITRDLFFLGKALGRKYIYLRLCYNVFMFGIIAAVLAFAIAFTITASA